MKSASLITCLLALASACRAAEFSPSITLKPEYSLQTIIEKAFRTISARTFLTLLVMAVVVARFSRFFLMIPLSSIRNSGRSSRMNSIARSVKFESHNDGDAIHWYWPRFPRPKTVLVVERPATPEEYILLQTLSGMAARAEIRKRSNLMIWIASDDSAYQQWFEAMRRQFHPKIEKATSVWEALGRLRQMGIVKGYLLYHYDDSPRQVGEGKAGDTSANAATSLCAVLDGVAVADTLETKAKQAGLARLSDVRNLSEEDIFIHYENRFSRKALALRDPKAAEIRDEAVALGAFICSGPGPLYERALARLDPDSPILGWGLGDERDITLPSTCYGAFQTSTDWSMNLPVLSTETPGRSFADERLRRPETPTLWDLTWEDNVHYATFIMSDGDNIQWMMGNFPYGRERSWWNHPSRGRAPIGWTICYDQLAQVCPYAIEHLFRTATPQDDFLVFGGGYYYPDFFGSRRTEPNLLALHAARLGGAMRKGGLRLLMVNVQRHDSPSAALAYAVYAREIPALLGIFTIDYDRYTAGGGAARWTKGASGEETPVLPVRYAIWNHSSDAASGDPARVASLLNESAHRGDSSGVDHFSAVIVHAWSWFGAPTKEKPVREIDQSQGGATGTGRGTPAVMWCVKLLQPYVRILTPTEFVLQFRLRAHPEPTLRTALNALRRTQTKLLKRFVGARSMPQLFMDSNLALRQSELALDNRNYRLCFLQGQRLYQLQRKALRREE